MQPSSFSNTSLIENFTVKHLRLFTVITSNNLIREWGKVSPDFSCYPKYSQTDVKSPLINGLTIPVTPYWNQNLEFKGLPYLLCTLPSLFKRLWQNFNRYNSILRQSLDLINTSLDAQFRVEYFGLLALGSFPISWRTGSVFPGCPNASNTLKQF